MKLHWSVHFLHIFKDTIVESRTFFFFLFFCEVTFVSSVNLITFLSLYAKSTLYVWVKSFIIFIAIIEANHSFVTEAIKSTMQ